MKKLLVILTISVGFNLSAQLPNGSWAPDFTITDINGTSHNLYSYLNAGKTVFIDIFAAHCPSCWSYHNTERLKNMYNLYGPDGTDEIMVLALEHDEYNTMNELTGIGGWQTAGDWVTGTPYPIFNVEGGDRQVFVDYMVNYYPLIYKICPGGQIEQISTSLDETMLYQKVQDCIAHLSIEEAVNIDKLYINQLNKNLVLDDYDKVNSIQIYNIQGQLIKSISSVSSNTIPVNDLDNGVYLFRFETKSGPITKKFYIE